MGQHVSAHPFRQKSGLEDRNPATQLSLLGQLTMHGGLEKRHVAPARPIWLITIALLGAESVTMDTGVVFILICRLICYHAYSF